MKTFYQINDSCEQRDLTEFRNPAPPAKFLANAFREGSLRLAKRITVALTLLAMSTTLLAQKPGTDLTDKSIEFLMDIEVTSVSKKEERLFQAAAAV